MIKKIIRISFLITGLTALCLFFLSASVSAADEDTYLSPVLSVDIPTISFSQILKEGDYLEVNWIGEYVTGLYKYLLATAAIFAVIMLMVGGIQYIISLGGGEVQKAKDRIKNALTGMTLLFCVFLILYTVNPQLVMFETLQVQMVPPAPYLEEDDVVQGTAATSLGTVSGSNIIGPGVNKIPTELIGDVQAAAAALASKGITLSIASSYRSVEQQIALIKENCQNPPGSTTCNAKSGHPPTCILKDNNPANCPHTTGRALDIWGVQNSRQCVRQSVCLKDMASCFQNSCQAAVIAVMKAQGFCSLSTEAWHFEKPKMSSKCN